MVNGHFDDLPDDEALIREYEARYGAGEKQKNQPKRKRSSYPMTPSADERRWAMIAHASAWLTLLGGFMTLGILIPFSIFIPLIIYLNFRKQSEYIANQALQAFAVQILGTVGVVVLGVVGGILWGVGLAIAILLMLALIGFVLVPIWGIVGLVLFLAIVLLPIAMLFFSTIAAFETHRGQHDRYPLIGRWLDRKLASRSNMIV